tara:strand:+ start:589 stop:702 length:114 start_codon:yes stop_codon:yes gene_type:complete
MKSYLILNQKQALFKYDKKKQIYFVNIIIFDVEKNKK